MNFHLEIGLDGYHITALFTPDEAEYNRIWGIGKGTSNRETKRGVEALDRQVERILGVQPSAGLFVRLLARPAAAWSRRHPEEFFVCENGQRHDSPFLSSDRFWRTVSKSLAATIRYCERQPWARNIVGYGNYHHTEGIHMPVGDEWLFDQSPLMLKAWRAFLRKKYKTAAALRKAYGHPILTFDTVNVPKTSCAAPFPK